VVGVIKLTSTVSSTSEPPKAALTVTVSTVLLVGTSTSTIAMQAKDVNGNNLTTGGLTVTMSVNGSATLSSVSDNTDGTYTALQQHWLGWQLELSALP
jgi:hypothetical protein